MSPKATGAGRHIAYLVNGITFLETATQFFTQQREETIHLILYSFSPQRKQQESLID
jgi:hypothetical protein